MTALPVIPAVIVVALLLLDFRRIIERSRIVLPRKLTPYELQIQKMAANFNAMGQAIGQALLPTMQQACESMAALGRAFAASGLTPERIEAELRIPPRAGARKWSDL